MGKKKIKWSSTSFTIRQVLTKTNNIYHIKFTIIAKSEKTKC